MTAGVGGEERRKHGQVREAMEFISNSFLKEGSREDSQVITRKKKKAVDLKCFRIAELDILTIHTYQT